MLKVTRPFSIGISALMPSLRASMRKYAGAGRSALCSRGQAACRARSSVTNRGADETKMSRQVERHHVHQKLLSHSPPALKLA